MKIVEENSQFVIELEGVKYYSESDRGNQNGQFPCRSCAFDSNPKLCGNAYKIINCGVHSIHWIEKEPTISKNPDTMTFAQKLKALLIEESRKNRQLVTSVKIDYTHGISNKEISQDSMKVQITYEQR